MENLTSGQQSLYCEYYTAYVVRSEAWFLVAILKSMEHLAFDRTLDAAASLFEFFVPAANETAFVVLMNYFKEQGIIRGLTKLPNRLLDPAQEV